MVFVARNHALLAVTAVQRSIFAGVLHQICECDQHLHAWLCTELFVAMLNHSDTAYVNFLNCRLLANSIQSSNVQDLSFVCALQGLPVDWATETLVTVGATEGIAACFLGLLNPGDEVVYTACVP